MASDLRELVVQPLGSCLEGIAYVGMIVRRNGSRDWVKRRDLDQIRPN